MDDKALNEKLLAQITDTLYHTGEQKQLNITLVDKFVAKLQYIFRKDPKKKDDRCMLCQD